MTEANVVGILAQVPIIGIAFYFIGREINALAKRIDEQNSVLISLIKDNNEVLRGVTEAMTAVKVLVEKAECPMRDPEIRSKRT